MKSCGCLKKIIMLGCCILLLTVLSTCAAAEACPDYTGMCCEVPVRLDGEEAGTGCIYIDTYYMPVDRLCDKAGISAEWSVDGNNHTLSGPGFSLQYCCGDHFIVINHRYYYSADGFPCIDGAVYITVGMAERLFNVSASICDYSIYVDTEGISLPADDPDYYVNTYGQDTVWWLSHIICAEGYYEGLEGHLGIGNVIMNRVASDRYPDTVQEVLLDTRGDVQFASVEEEAFFIKPNEISMVATYLALEGVSVVEDSLFFMSPEGCGTTWFDDWLELVTVIDNHRFYRPVG